MQIIDETSHVLPQPNVATIGFFDGLHLGHQFLIQQVKDEALNRGLKSSVITFPIHPSKVLNPEKQVDHITLKEEKMELLGHTAIDYCFVLPFSKELSKYSAKEFMQYILRDKFNVTVLVIGYDHRFGHNRADGFEQYVVYGKELGIEVIQAHEFKKEGMNEFSSSTIRRHITDGEVEMASSYLGYPYFVEGTVIEGKQLGRTIGFPTANIEVESIDKMVPKDGVYAVRVRVENDANLYWGMLNIGHRPTVDNGSNKSIEVNIFDFKRNIYGEQVRLCFVKRLRSEQRFGSVDELVGQLHKDEAIVRALIVNKQQ